MPEKEVKMTSRKEVFHYGRALLFPDLLSIGPLAVGVQTPFVSFHSCFARFVLSLSFRFLVVFGLFPSLAFTHVVG
jgi:hypothetical protein